jgi:hypothetical protein
MREYESCWERELKICILILIVYEPKKRQIHSPAAGLKFEEAFEPFNIRTTHSHFERLL